ncbi:MAG: 23S rRNA (guanosine(2251)-2'-O)-methyltransferase RlmB [Christensenellaceae bacterium]|jgi:23S rRNA (guanosine2251-2'-O)-methyltransferase|nr:23S rRNA (guanosine(2251)-2'-O)-methyltransferase RlmB [Christensenellaceae bacterium]
MIIAGINAVSEALKGNITVEKLYIRKGLFTDKINSIIATAKSKGIRVVFEEKIRIDARSESINNQGVVAETTEFAYSSVEDILNARKSNNDNRLILLLDGIEDPHNLGAILRVADSAAVCGVIIPRHHAVGVNDTVMKASAGAAAHVLVAKVPNINDTIRYLKDEFINVYAADSSGDDIYLSDLTGDVAIVVGGEGEGVHKLTQRLANRIIALPQEGKVNSLNASVATGIILYEALRQRRKNSNEKNDKSKDSNGDLK